MFLPTLLPPHQRIQLHPVDAVEDVLLENEATQFADEVYVMDGGKLSTQRGGIIMGKKPVRLYVELFLTFLKVGLFTFGGGYAMIPIIEHTCVEQKRWITHDEMMDVTVMAESTPGPIAINCATYVGYRQAKMPGAITATLGVRWHCSWTIFWRSPSWPAPLKALNWRSAC